MVFGKALSPEDFKHLSMGFGGDENGIFGQLYDGNKPSGAGAFTIDNININGVDYGAVRVTEDGRFSLSDLDLNELPEGSVITITIGDHSFKISIEDKVFSNKTKYNESTENGENSNDKITDDGRKLPINGGNPKSTGNGTGSGFGANKGSGSGEANFTGSGISVGDVSGQSNAGTGDSGENGGGSESEGVKAYEIFKEEKTPVTAKNSQLIAIFGVAFVILIIALGYRSKNKDDYQDGEDYSL